MPIIEWRRYSPGDFAPGNVVRLWMDYGSDAVSLRQGEVIDPRNLTREREKLKMRVDFVGWAPMWGVSRVIIDENDIGRTSHRRRVSRLPYTRSFSYYDIFVAEKKYGKGWRVI